MLNYLKAFFVFFLWVAIALTSHHFITHQYFEYLDNSLENSSIKSDKTNISAHSILKIKSGNDVVFKFVNGIQITKNESKVSALNSIPFLIDSISKYLNNNYTKHLAIVGTYNNTESNTNLGKLRANNVKNELIKNGFDRIKINTEGKNEAFVFNKNNNYSNGIDLNFVPLNEMILDSIETIIINKRIYLDYTNNNLVFNTELINYTNLVKQYLKRNPTKTVKITGHTDNKGFYENNLIIGQNKANALKAYFIKNGISENAITALSQGESEPIANKYTEEGKALNNRIEIRIN